VFTLGYTYSDCRPIGGVTEIAGLDTWQTGV